MKKRKTTHRMRALTALPLAESLLSVAKPPLTSQDFRRRLKVCNPGYLYLAAFLLEGEPRKERILLELARSITEAHRGMPYQRPWKAPALSHTLREAMDKAVVRSLLTLAGVLRSLHEAAQYADLYELERAAAIASGRKVTMALGSDAEAALDGVLEWYEMGWWWREEHDRKVRAHL